MSRPGTTSLGTSELPGFRTWKLRSRSPLSNLLTPHRIVQARPLEQVFVLPNLHYPAALENVDPVRMHDRRKAVRDENRYHFARVRDISHRATDLFLGQRVE